jgi:DsbC/DsbD-like thiol-disulfide interchange protein
MHMRRTILALVYGSLLLGSAACSKTEQANGNAGATPTASASPTSAKTPPANIVIAGATEVQIEPGMSAEAAVQLSITSGYHINANPASASFLLATTLEVERSEGLIISPPKYPPSITKKFAFSPDPLAVYEGEAIIKVQLKAGTDAKKGERTLKAKVRVQPCDDQVCYPPRTIETSIPVVVK